MTPEEIETICRKRLEGWTKKLVDGHATPMLTVGMGHDHASGTLVVCVVDSSEMPDKVVAAALRYAADQLDPKGKRHG